MLGGNCCGYLMAIFSPENGQKLPKIAKFETISTKVLICNVGHYFAHKWNQLNPLV